MSECMECGELDGGWQGLCGYCQDEILADERARDEAYDREQARVDHITGGLSAGEYNRIEEAAERGELDDPRDFTEGEA